MIKTVILLFFLYFTINYTFLNNSIYKYKQSLEELHDHSNYKNLSSDNLNSN